MSLYLGIDGGGTKTTCAVGDETSVFATAHGSGSNFVRLGEAQAKAGLQSAISQACSQAGVSPLRVLSACVGAAGAANPDVNTAVRTVVRQILPNAEVVVVGDMVIAMEASLHGNPGVVVISGTGSIAYGRNAIGEIARAGGWGFAISDEGSGQWIGRTAVADAMRAFDAKRPTVLLDRILEAWTLDSRDALIPFANSSPAPNFAELFPVVMDTAREGDLVAAAVLTSAGEELARLALTVMLRLWKHDENVRIGVAGGVFANSAHVRRAFYDALLAKWAKMSVCFKVVDPVLGALSLARRSAAAMGAR